MEYLEFRICNRHQDINKELFADALKNNSPILIQYMVRKNEVLRQDYSRIRSVLNVFSDAGILAAQSLVLSFDGYDSDPRELTEIEEVRKYLKNVVGEFPHVWYFLIPVPNMHVFAGLVDYTMYSIPLKKNQQTDYPQSSEKYVQLDMISASMLVAEMESAISEYCTAIDDILIGKCVIADWRRVLNI